MRKRLVVWILLLLLACLVLGIAWMTPSPSAVHAEDLLIDLSVLPRGWSVKSSFSALGDYYVLQDQGASDWAGVEFAPPIGTKGLPWQGTSQMVWKFGWNLGATLEFYRRFQPPRSALSEVDLQGWSYRSDVADRFWLFCGIVKPIPEAHIEGGWTACQAIGQYEQFISSFTTPIGSEYNMTLDDLERILETIDERMAQHLKGDAY